MKTRAFVAVACRETKPEILFLKKCGGLPAVSLRWPNLALALVCAGNLFASDITSDFSAANKFYAQGKFLEAAKAYETILQSGATSPALLFNCGNAEFKAGHLGKAIAAYQRAEQLSPRDAELRANLAFVRNQVQGVALRESRWQNWVSTLTLNEGALLTAILFWLTFTLIIALQLRPALVPKLRNTTWIFAVLTIFSATVLGLQAANHFFNASAVVVADNVTARSGPFDDAQSAFTARDGAELSVMSQRDGLGAGRRWHGKDRLAAGKTGGSFAGSVSSLLVGRASPRAGRRRFKQLARTLAPPAENLV